jgi:hypothetical protein
MLFAKRLVTTQDNFHLSVVDTLFDYALEEGLSVDEAIAALWEGCCSCCYEEDCEAFIILMNDGSDYEFEAGHIGDEKRFGEFIRRYWGEVLSDYERELQRTKTA